MPFHDTTVQLTVDEATEPEKAAVRRMLARRASDEGWTRAEIIQAAEALGLIEYEAGGQTDELGHNRPPAGARKVNG